MSHGAQRRRFRDGDKILEAALAAVEPESLVRRAMPRLGSITGPVDVVAIGKAAAGMMRGALGLIGNRRRRALAIVPVGARHELPAGVEVFAGGHPIPSPEGAEGARRILALATAASTESHDAGSHDTGSHDTGSHDTGSHDTGSHDIGSRILFLISGGASALAALPPDAVPLEDLQTLTAALLRSGADIHELNTVRKHLDQLKGGRLARAASPARVDAWVLSDVIGDPLEVIASGPLSPDSTTFRQAIAVIENRHLWQDAPPTVREYLQAGERGEVAESPDTDDPAFQAVQTVVLAGNGTALKAAATRADELGYRVEIITAPLAGEARVAGRDLARELVRRARQRDRTERPLCLLGGGETTVTVRGQGRGGPNQELALAAAVALAEAPGIALLSFGSDGIDGPTDAAGARVDGSTVERARALGLDPRQALRENDAYPFFDRLGDLLRPGPTGTNVMDLQVGFVD